MWRFVLGQGCLVFVLSVPSVSAQCPSADVILDNGHIITMDGQRSVVSVLAIRDGRIEAVGNSQAVADCAGAATRKVDLKGKTLLPGFIDVHTHAIIWAKSIVRGEVEVGYPAVHNIGEIQAAIAKRPVWQSRAIGFAVADGTTPNSQSTAT